MNSSCINATVCFISRNNKILLQKRPDRQRWAGILNGPGGKIERNETPLQAVIREVAEETTLVIRETTLHGTVRLVFNGSREQQLLVHIFSTSTFSGRPRGAEGTLRWYSKEQLPFDRMWPDQRYWLPLVLAGGRLNALSHFDEAGSILQASELHLQL